MLVPDKPLMIHTNEQPKSTSFSVKWLAPERVNGHIMSYELRWQHDNVTKTKVISKYLNNPMQEQVTNLSKSQGSSMKLCNLIVKFFSVKVGMF